MTEDKKDEIKNESVPAPSSDEAIEELKKKSEEYLNGWKRERADFINYKKDEMERIGSLIKYANEEILLNILPVLDNLLLARVHINDNGLSQVIKQFQDLLKKEGIEPIKTTGEVFNPTTMEAVGETEGGLNNTVSEEVQCGYTMHGKVIRVAKVRINK